MNIVIEGSIGAGKSTLVEALVTVLQRDHRLKANGILEPLNEWQNTPEGDVLSLFGENREYAFLTQVLIMSTIGTDILFFTKETFIV